MLFKRRNEPSLRERVRVWMWPRRSWSRSTRYVWRRIWRLNASPHAIALGTAIGICISFTPFLGFHFVLAALIAWSLGGNIIASALGTFVGNPLTFPFIWISAYKSGLWLLGEVNGLQNIDFEGLFAKFYEGLASLSFVALEAVFLTFWPVFKPMAVGGPILGVVAGIISYYPLRKAIEAYKRQTQLRLKQTNFTALH